MPELSCEQIQDSLIEMNELDPVMEKHIKSCKNCKAEFAALKQIHLAGSPVFDLTPSAEFLHAIENECCISDVSKSATPANFSVTFVLVILVTVALMIAGLLAYNDDKSDKNVSQSKEIQREDSFKEESKLKKKAKTRNLLIDSPSGSSVMKFEAPEKDVD